MKKVYVVTSGDYSDYKIEAIFSTNELAEEFKAAFLGINFNDIEEYEFDLSVARGHLLWRVYMLIDGTTEQVERVNIVDSIPCSNHWLWRRADAPAYIGKGIPDILVSTVWAKTEQHAVKIVNEYRIQMIANGEWD